MKGNGEAHFVISKASSISELEDVFEGSIPDYHPEDFWQTRFNEKRIFLAKQKNHNVGFLVYTIWWGNCPFIELIKIRPDFQKQGFGTLLLKEAAKELHSKHFKTLISSSEVINAGGNKFHDAIGFEKLDILKLPHGEEQFYSVDIQRLIT
jgi:L-amino acid N-acyltransferase YncA